MTFWVGEVWWCLVRLQTFYGSCCRRIWEGCWCFREIPEISGRFQGCVWHFQAGFRRFKKVSGVPWSFLKFGAVSDIFGRLLTYSVRLLAFHGSCWRLGRFLTLQGGPWCFWEGCWRFREIPGVSGMFLTFQAGSLCFRGFLTFERGSWRCVVFPYVVGGFWRFG